MPHGRCVPIMEKSNGHVVWRLHVLLLIQVALDRALGSLLEFLLLDAE